MMLFSSKKTTLPTPDKALPGRKDPIKTASSHAITGNSLKKPYPPGFERAMFGMGCFWGAERKFYRLGKGIYITAVGYAGGYTPNATYEEVCTGRTGHNEVVLIVFDPQELSYPRLLKTFWEGHDPTQGMAQGNDVGTQYRSGIYTFTPEQKAAAVASRKTYNEALSTKGLGPVTTEIEDAPTFYFAEDYHQQYLEKNPGGYCGLGGTGVSCSFGDD